MPVRSRSRASSATRNSPAVGLQGAQFVQAGVVAVGDDAAFAQQRRRLRQDRRARADRGIRRLGEAARSSARRGATRRRCRGEFGQRGEAVAQAGEVARPRAFQRDARRRCAPRRQCGAMPAPQRAACRPRAVLPRLRGDSPARRGRAGDDAASGATAGCPCRWRSHRAARTASGRASPRRVSVSSRLRRVAASMRT